MSSEGALYRSTDESGQKQAKGNFFIVQHFTLKTRNYQLNEIIKEYDVIEVKEQIIRTRTIDIIRLCVLKALFKYKSIPSIERF